MLVESGSANLVGGTTAAQRNIISGNQTGVVLRSSNNRVQGNYVGTDPAGQSAIANQTGVSIESGQSNIVGFTNGGAANLISGNDVGVAIKAGSQRIAGNRIGTRADGFSALGNRIGVSITGGDSSVVGGSSVEQRNLIAGNETGVLVSAPRNRVAGNWIGVDTFGPYTLGQSNRHRHFGFRERCRRHVGRADEPNLG